MIALSKARLGEEKEGEGGVGWVLEWGSILFCTVSPSCHIQCIEHGHHDLLITKGGD